MDIMRRINWNPKNQVKEGSITAPPPIPVPVQPPVQTSVVIRPKITRNRVGNGHKSEMVRKLNDQERDLIRSVFIAKNGQIEEDDCVTIKPSLGEDIAIFQITGFVSYLHRDVAIARTQLRDLTAYKTWMANKYAGLWTQYNSDKVRRLRQHNVLNRASNIPLQGASMQDVPITPQFSTTPRFKALPRQYSYARTGT